MSDIWSDDWSSKPEKEAKITPDFSIGAGKYEIEDKSGATSYKPQVRVMRRDQNGDDAVSGTKSGENSRPSTPQQMKDLEEIRRSKREAYMQARERIFSQEDE